MLDDLNEYPLYIDADEKATIFQPFKIKNGSTISIGEKCLTKLKVDQHFNWFQKLMWKWCFGFKVEDYKEKEYD